MCPQHNELISEIKATNTKIDTLVDTVRASDLSIKALDASVRGGAGDPGLKAEQSVIKMQMKILWGGVTAAVAATAGCVVKLFATGGAK